jgi:hypothetical protein
MSTAYVPYKGTAGWSGSDTSKARAVDNVKSGKEINQQQKALAYLKQHVHGLTWKEFAELAMVHHGTASGVLSVLHKAGTIVRSTEVRLGCKVYYHPDNAKNVVAELHGRKHTYCPHCGNDINA